MSSEVIIPRTFLSRLITGRADMLCCAIFLDAASIGSSGVVVTTFLMIMFASFCFPSATALVMSHEVTMPLSFSCALTTTMWLTERFMIRWATVFICSSSLQVMAGWMRFSTKVISLVCFIGLHMVSVGRRSIGAVR